MNSFFAPAGSLLGTPPQHVCEASSCCVAMLGHPHVVCTANRNCDGQCIVCTPLYEEDKCFGPAHLLANRPSKSLAAKEICCLLTGFILSFLIGCRWNLCSGQPDRRSVLEASCHRRCWCRHAPRTKSEIQSYRTELLEKVVSAVNRAEDACIYVMNIHPGPDCPQKLCVRS